MTNQELLQHQHVLTLLSKSDNLPIGWVIADNLKEINAHLSAVGQEQAKLVKQYAVTDDKGNLLGKKEGKSRKKIEEQYLYEDLDIPKRKEFNVKLKALQEKEVKFEWTKVSRNKPVWVKRTTLLNGQEVSHDVESTLGEVLEERLSANLLLYIGENLLS